MDMEIKKAEFIISAVSPRQYPNDEKTEIAFVGRSNVGKSSLLNTLTNRKKLARTSNTPGRTREINFFKINDEFYFVDLPGYGYAKISKKEKAKWGKIIEEYLSDRPQLKKIILLVDSRHVPTKDDVMMYNWIKHYNIPCIIVATKVDKISNNVLFKNKKIIRETLNIKEHDEFIPFSSLSKKGREEVLQRL